MRTLAITFASAAAAFAAFSYSGTARAIGPVDIEIAARVGFASTPSNIPTNPYGLGLGGRAGVSIFGIYGGVSGIYYLGSSIGGASYHTAMEGFEVGYTLPIPVVKIRPQIGIGNASFIDSTGGQSISSSYLYLEPGALVFIPFGHFFAGADVNALLVPSVTSAVSTNGTPSKTTEVSLSVHGQFGVRF